MPKVNALVGIGALALGGYALYQALKPKEAVGLYVEGPAFIEGQEPGPPDDPTPTVTISLGGSVSPVWMVGNSSSIPKIIQLLSVMDVTDIELSPAINIPPYSLGLVTFTHTWSGGTGLFPMYATIKDVTEGLQPPPDVPGAFQLYILRVIAPI